MRRMRNFIIAMSIWGSMLAYQGCVHHQPPVGDREPGIEAIYQTDEPEIKEISGGWLEVTGQAFIQNITPEEAKRQAILEACQKAIEYCSGIKISGRILDIQAGSRDTVLLDHFVSLTNQTTTGIILDKKLIREGIKYLSSAPPMERFRLAQAFYLWC